MERDGWRSKLKAECGDLCRCAVVFLSLLFYALANGKQ